MSRKKAYTEYLKGDYFITAESSFYLDLPRKLKKKIKKFTETYMLYSSKYKLVVFSRLPIKV